MSNRVLIPNWHFDSAGLIVKENLLCNFTIIIAGPSGVGKTTLATLLAKKNSRLSIIRNYTTRKPRESDPKDHFEYIAKTEFIKRFKDNLFFMCRSKPNPCYGYLKTELNDIAGKKKRALFMFRHSGVNFITKLIKRCPVVFLEGDAKKILKHSSDKLESHSVDSIETAIDRNRTLNQQLKESSYPTLVLTNTFSGERELQTLAEEVMIFIQGIYNV